MTPAIIAFSLFALVPASATPSEREIQAILTKRCIGCHGPTKQRGNLRLDRKTDALRGGDSGAVIIPGKPQDSLLLKRVLSRDSDEQMPPTGERLTEKQIATLTAWIKAGANWEDQTTDAERRHWAFEPVKRPKLAATGSAAIDALIGEQLQAQNLKFNPAADRRTLIRRLKYDLLGLPPTAEEVTAFVADTAPDAYAKLVDRYLSTPQYGERWGRHWLDVVRYAESNGFEMNNPRPNAWRYRDYVIRSFNEDKPYDQFLREQLAGDQLGADAATGFLVAGPWDQVKSPDPVLTANQRADELHDMVSTTGSAFLGLTIGCARCHYHKFDPISQVDYYRLSAVFAGVQHGERAIPVKKSDDIAQRKAKLTEEVTQVDQKLANLEPLADPAATRPRRHPVNARLNRERFPAVSAKYVRFLIQATTDVEPCLDELEVFSVDQPIRNVALASAGGKVTSAGDYPNSPIHQLRFLIDGQYGNSHSWISNQVGRGRVTIELAKPERIDRIVWARDREGKFADRLATRYRVDVSLDGQTWQVVASSDDRLPQVEKSGVEPIGLNPVELKQWRTLQAKAKSAREELARLTDSQMAYAGRFTTPEPTFRLHRGDPMSRREPIAPGVLAEIGPKWDSPKLTSEAERRIALAKWITSPQHPLTPRVIVNRLWQQHFGTGLVTTASDFGRNGAKPTHPKLLDWLAAELVQPSDPSARPWALKPIQRLIVLSATYQQSSAATEQGLERDAQTRLLWRYPPRRLDAEELRDSILAVTGKLDLTPGGPGFDLFEPNNNYVRVFTPKNMFGPAEFRRMVYQTKHRMQLDDTFGAFDCPDGGQIVPKRNQSTTALQALNLLNSPFLMQQSEAFAARVASLSKEPTEQVRRVFELAYQRVPLADEQAGALALVKEHGLVALCRAILNSNEFLYID